MPDILCKSCGKNNDIANSRCVHCNSPLILTEEDLPAIQAEINNLEQYFNNKIHFLRTKIFEIESNQKKQNKTIEAQSEASIQKEHSYSAIKKVSDNQNESEKLKDLSFEEKPALKERQNQEALSQKDEKELTEESISWLTMLIPGPITYFIDIFLNIYKQYKEENKLTLFFLTLSGILTFLLGFGYLLQYSYNNFFDDFTKVLSGFAIGAVVIAIGVILFKKSETFKQFASALIGLGLSVNYITIYFLTSFFYLAPPLVGFILIICNTLLSAYLALIFETKVIAVVTLLAGALTPFYLDQQGIYGGFYFIYLWSLIVISYYLSIKIQIKSFNVLSFLITTAVLTYSILFFTDKMSFYNYIISLHGFAYFYFIIYLFESFKFRQKLDRQTTGIILANFSFFAFNLFVLTIDFNLLGFIYLFNALPFLLAIFIRKLKPSKKMQALLFFIAGSFAALAIFSLFSRPMMGIFWGIEGILLLYYGLVFQLKSIRIKSYIILSIAIYSIAQTAFTFIPGYTEKPFLSDCIFYFSALSLVLLLPRMLFSRFQKILPKNEKPFHSLIEELLSISMVILYFLVSYYYLNRYCLTLSILPMFILLYWGHKKQLYFTQFLGFFMLFPICIQIFISMLETQSIYFYDQTLIGKTAILEAISLLWFWQYFYEKILGEKKKLFFVKAARSLFYLILPLTLLSPFHRFLPEYLLTGLWLSTLTAYLLYKKLQSHGLEYEFYLLSIISTILSFGYFHKYQLKLDGPEFIAVISGLAVILFVTLYEKAFTKQGYQKTEFKFFINAGVYYLGAALLFTAMGTSKTNTFTCLVPALYFGIISYFKSSFYPVRHSYQLSYRLYHLFLIFSLIWLFSDFLYSLPDYMVGYFFVPLWITLILMFATIGIGYFLIYKRNSLYPNKKSNFWYYDLYFYHFYIASFYLFVIKHLTDSFIGPFVTVSIMLHAILILFYSLKQRYHFIYKLSIIIFAIAFIKLFFHDIAGFSLLYKIIVFMLSGVLLLISAFFFQKLKESLEKKNSTIKDFP